MSRRKREAQPIPAGDAIPVELIKSEVIKELDGRQAWVTWFRAAGKESRVFFHLDVDRLRFIAERHAAALGFKWDGDLFDFLRTSHYSDHHAIEGWEGVADVTFQGRNKYRLRIRRDHAELES